MKSYGDVYWVDHYTNSSVFQCWYFCFKHILTLAENTKSGNRIIQSRLTQEWQCFHLAKTTHTQMILRCLYLTFLFLSHGCTNEGLCTLKYHHDTVAETTDRAILMSMMKGTELQQSRWECWIIFLIKLSSFQKREVKYSTYSKDVNFYAFYWSSVFFSSVSHPQVYWRKKLQSISKQKVWENTADWVVPRYFLSASS